MKPMSLPLPVPPRRRNSPGTKRESDAIYSAVVALRKAGFRVWRGGDRTYLVNGERCDFKRLMAKAEAEGAGA